MMTDFRELFHRIADRVIALWEEGHRAALKRHRKIATRRVFDSILGIRDVRDNRLTIEIEADEGWFWINKGRRPGGKYPVEKRGNRFRLVPRLRRWKQAVGFNGPDFLLARSIAVNGIDPVPLNETVDELVGTDIENAIEFELDDFLNNHVDDMINFSLRGL